MERGVNGASFAALAGRVRLAAFRARKGVVILSASEGSRLFGIPKTTFFAVLRRRPIDPELVLFNRSVARFAGYR